MSANEDAILLRLHLDTLTPKPLRSGFAFASFSELDAEEVETVLVAARADGLAGDPEKQIGWFERVRRDPQWADDLVVLVRKDVGRQLVGVAHSWNEAFLKDVAVDAEHRRMGIAQALIAETARRFRERGWSHLDLKVRPANVPARNFYARLGFEEVAD